MNYDPPIESRGHADWCLKEAARRYGGKVIWNDDNFPVIEDANGITHTDAVLRAIGVWRGGDG